MKRFLCGIVALLAGVTCFAAPKAQAAVCAARATEAGPIVFNAKAMAYGKSVELFSAYRFDGTRFIPIPLQIDEKNASGDYVLEGGLPYTTNTDDGFLDNNDELAIKGADLGQAFQAGDVKTFLAGAVAEAWQLRFCRGEAWLGNMLLVASRSIKASAFPPAVAFSPTGKSVLTEHYRYQFRADNPILLGDVLVKRDGKERRLFANSWFHMMFKLPWWLPDFQLTNENFTSEIESWRIGCVRTIVAVGVKLKKFLSIFNFHMFSELVFYPGSFEIPTVLEFPVSPHSFFKPGSGLVYHVAFPAGENWEIEAELLNVEDPEFVADFSPRPARGKPYVVNLLAPWGRLSLNVVLGSNNGKALPEPLLVRKSLKESKINFSYFEWLKDNPGDLGVFTDISQIEKGRYHFSLDLRLNFEADQRAYVAFDRPKVQWETLSQH